MTTALQQVHLRINDAATGKPTAARVRITDSHGHYYAPFGRLTEFSTSNNQDVGGNVMIGLKKWAYLDGACEILLPPGELHIEISKGPEYKPIDETVTLLAGKMSLRFTLERWCDQRADGWHASDTRAHFLTTEGALLEGQAEDLALVHLLAKETTVPDAFGKTVRAIPNLLAFSGQQFKHTENQCAVAVSTYNEHPRLGSLALLHCHRVVYPLTFGGAKGLEDWTLLDWCGQCHRKKGLVIWANPLHQADFFAHGEPLADLVLGEIDAFEVTFFEDSPFDATADYYELLNAGLNVPLVGASGKESNGVALGSMRTYTHVGEFTYASWVEAVRAGRTFITNGPLLRFTIDGQTVGSRLNLDASATQVAVHTEAQSWLPFSQLELLWNGAVIASASASAGPPYRATLDHALPIEQGGWLAVRCRGEMLIPCRPAPQRVFAHSSAVTIRKVDARPWISADAVQRLLKELDAMLAWAKTKARCDTDAQREHLCGVFAKARTTLVGNVS